MFRIPPELAENKDLQFLPKSHKPTKMIVVGDGDIIKNQFQFTQDIPCRSDMTVYQADFWQQGFPP